MIVNIERLEWTDDGYGDKTLDGKYYTGVAFEVDEETNLIIGLVGYLDGRFHGASRSWSPSGQPIRETYYFNGGYHGPLRKWHQNGVLAEEDYCEYGLGTRGRKWNEHGELVEETGLREGDYRIEQLERERARGLKPVVDIDLSTLQFFERGIGWGENPADISPPPPPPSTALCRSLETRA